MKSIRMPDDCFVIPVHPYQASRLNLQKTPILSISCRPQASFRTLSSDLMFDFKLSVDMISTSSIRLLSLQSLINGPKVSELAEELKSKLQISSVGFCREIASAGIMKQQGRLDVACIIRESPLAVVKRDFDEDCFPIPCMMLMEKEYIAWLLPWLDMNSTCFLRQYSELILKTFVPFALLGLAFEAHMQNTILVVSKKERKIKGFIERDFGSVKIDLKRLHDRTCIQCWLADKSSIIADKYRDCCILLFHSMIQMHLAPLIEFLQEATDNPWNFVVAALGELKNNFGDDELFEYFLADTINFKCFLSMKLNPEVKVEFN